MRPTILLAALAILTMAAPGLAQTPPAPAQAPPEVTTGNVSFGLALTSGNKDTTTINASYEFKYDPRTKNVFKSTGLVLYGKSDGDVTAEQYGLNFRDEYAIGTRAYLYGDLRYLHDRFKGVSYLVTPTFGGGYKLVGLPATTLEASAGAGVVWEKDYGVDLQTTGAVTVGEKFTQKVSGTATFGQTFTALWKTADFGDAFYLFGMNLTATVIGSAQVKLEFIDTYKAKPADSALKKNDLTFIVGLVYKF